MRCVCAGYVTLVLARRRPFRVMDSFPTVPRQRDMGALGEACRGQTKGANDEQEKDSSYSRKRSDKAQQAVLRLQSM
jgi:hypothetical protein